jgi:hypothetical protein
MSARFQLGGGRLKVLKSLAVVPLRSEDRGVIGKTRPFQLFVVCPRSTMSRRPRSMSPKRATAAALPQASTREPTGRTSHDSGQFSLPHAANPVEDR